MFRYAKIGFVVLFSAATLLAAGCGQTPPKAQGPDNDKIAVVDVQKIIRSHPKQPAYQELRRQYDTLVARAETEQSRPGQTFSAGVPDSALQGINEALDQEFSNKMAAKQQELNVRLTAKAEQVQRDLSAQFDSYAKSVDETYQPQIFSLQLKLKTVQLSKEEVEKGQKQLEELQSERSAKLTAKEKELVAGLNAAMAPERAAAEQELSAYAAELHASLGQQGAAKSAELAGRLTNPGQTPSYVRSDLEQQAALKKQEIAALENAIIKDIEDKTAKIAAERGFSIVLGAYSLNISAVDLTDAVLAESKK